MRTRDLILRASLRDFGRGGGYAIWGDSRRYYRFGVCRPRRRAGTFSPLWEATRGAELRSDVRARAHSRNHAISA
jgi:hypothetical protein